VLEIEALAKRRLADEYDAAQERGEVRKHGQRGKDVPDKNIFSPATAADVGLFRKEIHEARAIRDAEKRDPGIVLRTVDAAVKAGKEPTKAAVRKATAKTAPASGRGRLACAFFRPCLHYFLH
jgi:hypothetical protein